jgi:Flp pilus assembly protein TadG
MTFTALATIGFLQRPRIPRRRTARRGASVLEMSIVLPIFLLITFGILVWGWLFFVRGTMYHAAREAARAIAVQEMTSTEGEAVAQGILDAALSSYSFTIDILNDADDPEIEVNVSIPMDDLGISALIPLRSTDMNARVIMVREGL